ncbi:hypothetical protein ACE41H_17810 [Paenibacillus enshidis]|uniref:Uncharacterized protein n=1 Tax=Paenibacillus enshidis TaxID=1458439 RepID=A0ABV5AWN3_9BACL
MKNQNRALIAGVAVIVVAAVAYAIYYFMTLNTTFQKTVLDQVNVDNVYLQIVRTRTAPSNESVEINAHVMDKEGVQTTLDQLSGIELQKVNEKDKKTDAPYYYDVYIRQKSDDSEVISFTVNNSESISIRKNNNSQNYKVINAFDYEAFRASIDKLYSEK